MLKIVYPICCGMDVHKNFVVACIATTDAKGVTTYKKMVGSFLADFIELLQIDGQPRLVGDGRDMQGCVGGTAQRHIYGDGIMKRFCRYDVPGTDVFLHQLHDLHAGVLGELDAGGDGSGDTAVARQRHAQRFAQTVHGVGREHAGTGTAGGAGGLLTLPKARIVQLALDAVEQTTDRLAVLSGYIRLLLPEIPVAVALAVFNVQKFVRRDRDEIGFHAVS